MAASAGGGPTVLFLSPKIRMLKMSVGKCLVSVKPSVYDKVDTIEAIYHVVDFEEEELKEYQEQRGPSYEILKADMTWLSQKLQKNIVVFVGHVEVMDETVKDLASKLKDGKISIPNLGLGTVFIGIACFSSKKAHDYNGGPPYLDFLLENKFIFVGFENLIHIYRGEIYMCKKPFLGYVRMGCNYPNALADKLEFDKMGLPNRLAKCCETKFGRFKSLFVKKFNERECYKITKENIYEKIEGIYSYLKDRTVKNRKKYRPAEIWDVPDEVVNLSEKNGYPCPSDKCDPENPYLEEEELANRFDKAEEPIEIGYKIVEYLDSLGPPTKESEAKLIKYLQSFKVNINTALVINNYTIKNEIVLFDFIEKKYYTTFLYCVKTYTIPVSMLGPTNATIFQWATRDRISEEDAEKLAEVFTILIRSFTKSTIPYLTNHRDSNGVTALYYAVLNENFSLAEVFLSSFGYTVADMNNQNPLKAKISLLNLLNVNRNFLPEFWELLLSFGVDPNQKEQGLSYNEPDGQTIVEKLFGWGGELERQEPILYALCIFGFEEKAIFLKEKRYYERIGSDNYVKILDTCLKIISMSDERKRKLRKQIRDRVFDRIEMRQKGRLEKLSMENSLPRMYANLNQSLKRPEVRLSRNQKTTLRKRGIDLMRNNSRNLKNRYLNMQGLLNTAKGIEPVVVQNNAAGGGRKFRKTRKNQT